MLLVAAVGLAVLLLAAAGTSYLLLHGYDSRVGRLKGVTAALPGAPAPAAAPHNARNLLLVGSDSRASTGSQFQGTGAAATTGQRSDTIIVVHLFGSIDQAQLVSFPRDSYVTIPAWTDPTTGALHPEHPDKINSAIDEGGPRLLIATVQRLTGIRVDNYLQIDFAGFQSMVDKLGGVQVCLLHPAKDSYSGINLPAGSQRLTGAQALSFVRQRHGLPDGDIDRIHRQQAFLAAVTRTALSSGTLLNPVKLDGFLTAAASTVQVDDTLTGPALTRLALRLSTLTGSAVTFTTAPYTTLSATRGGQDVVLLDDTKLGVLTAALRNDQNPQTAAAGPPGPSAAAPPAPGDTPAGTAPTPPATVTAANDTCVN